MARAAVLPGGDCSECSDEDLLGILHRTCHAYEMNYDWQIKYLKDQTIAVGKELNKRGGRDEMMRLYNRIAYRPGKKFLATLWKGVGDWTT